MTIWSSGNLQQEFMLSEYKSRIVSINNVITLEARCITEDWVWLHTPTMEQHRSSLFLLPLCGGAQTWAAVVTLWNDSGAPLLPVFLTMAATLSNSLCSRSTTGFLGFPAITSLWRVIWRTTKNEHFQTKWALLKPCTLKSSRHFHLCVTGQNLACDQSHSKGGWKSGESVFSSERWTQ